MKRLSLVTFFIFVTTMLFADEVEIDGVKYQIDDATKEASVINNSYTGDIVIKSSITYQEEEYTVTSVGYSAFQSCGRLTSVVLPQTVKTIDDMAFDGCSKLQSIVLSDSLTTIGSMAFRDCSKLTSISLPTKLKTIGESAFTNCTALSSIEIPASVTSLGKAVFRECNSLKSATIQGNSLKELPQDLFYLCSNLSSFVVPDSVLYVDESAFYYCSSLKQVVLPEGLLDIGKQCFFNCEALSDIQIPSSVTGIGASVFSYTAVTDVVIPEGVTELEKSTFESCVKLASVQLSSNLTDFGESVFCNCSQLKTIAIPQGVTILPVSLFQNCTSLQSITIPNTVTEIQEKAFEDCNSLTTIVLPDSLKMIGNYAFDGCYNLAQITIPENVTEIGNNAFANCALTSFILPQTIQKIGSEILDMNSGLKELIVFYENPIDIVSDAFLGVADSIPVYIPCGSLNAYQSKNGWNYFTNYIEQNGTFVINFDSEKGIIERDGDFCSEFTITVLPYDDYQFSQWSDGNTDNPRTFILNGDNISLDILFVDRFIVEPQYEYATCDSANGSISLEITGGVPPYTYLWSDGTTDSVMLHVAVGEYSVTVVDAVGATVSESLYMDRKNLWNYQPELDLVTVSQEAAPSNLVVWRKEPSDVLNNYTIYRETSVKDVYEPIATVPYSETSIYVDTTANSLLKSYRYKLSVTDVCGFESDQSKNHKTIHLQKNVGLNGEVNLSWDGYEGFDFSTYSVYRVTADTVEEIDKVTSDSWTYTDLNPVEGTLSYYVGVVLPEVVDANEPFMKAESGPFSLAISNIAELENLSVYALENNVLVFSKNQQILIKNASNAPIHVYSVNGVPVFSATGENAMYSIHVEEVGTYVVVVGSRTYKVVVTKE